jgi:predicted TIM-barrel fold metal-dependent hydrolase
MLKHIIMPTSSLPFTNAHSHIFTAQCAPDFFLKTAIKNESAAKFVDKLLQKNGTRTALKSIDWMLKLFSPNYRNSIRRYIEFIEIGTSATQEEILKKETQAYMRLGSYRVVALTQVLDFLDYNQPSSPHKKIQTQVQEVVDLKRNAAYKDILVPFLGIDPRMQGQGIDLLEWVTTYINKDKGFYGIKIYPAYGFYPFDARLDPVWKWAAQNNIPVMTHSTRGGSFYLGSFESIINCGGFTVPGLNPSSSVAPNITARIQALMATTDASLKKNNKVWCNVFGHPENYIPVLEKYPDLKICLAHLGGADEINRTGNKPPKPDYPDYLGGNWYEAIKKLMQDYPNVYSDISYTLSDPDAMSILVPFFKESALIQKLMYGTDFYLTQQETTGDEPDLINIFLGAFDKASINRLAYENPDTFLRSAMHP